MWNVFLKIFLNRSQDLEEIQDAGQFYWTNLNAKSDEIDLER